MNTDQSIFAMRDLGFCCESDACVQNVINVLREIRHEDQNMNWYEEVASKLKLDKYHVELCLFLLNLTDHAAHGGSSCGSWITPKGEEFLKEFDLLGKAE